VTIREIYGIEKLESLEGQTHPIQGTGSLFCALICSWTGDLKSDHDIIGSGSETASASFILQQAGCYVTVLRLFKKRLTR
jgi:hypothetical protein